MPTFTVVCAIEAGPLEKQTALMITTLRKFGGALAAAPVLVVQARNGAAIQSSTSERLAELDAVYTFAPELNKAPWFKFTNKVAALSYAQEHAHTEWCLWLDSDVLVTAEPSFMQRELEANLDVLARFEYVGPAITEQDTRHQKYWEKVLSLYQIKLSQVAFYDLDLPIIRMKPYFNSGILAWRRASRFLPIYCEAFYELLKARIAPKSYGAWFADQVAITPAIVASESRWDMLSARDHLMLFPGNLTRQDFRDTLPSAAIIHYSRARSGPRGEDFEKLISDNFPQIVELNEWRGADGPFPRIGALDLFRQNLRKVRQEIYSRTCAEY